MLTHDRPADKTQWETPPELFERLAHVFRFDLDVCAEHHTAKCERYFVRPEDCRTCGGSRIYMDHHPCHRCDGLAQPWCTPDGAAAVCWLNAPYGKPIGLWLAKAWEESQRGATVVALIPDDQSTAWFHDHVYRKADVWPLKGRVRFVGAAGSPNFGSLIAIYWPAGFWRGFSERSAR